MSTDAHTLVDRYIDDTCTKGLSTFARHLAADPEIVQYVRAIGNQPFLIVTPHQFLELALSLMSSGAAVLLDSLDERNLLKPVQNVPAN